MEMAPDAVDGEGVAQAHVVHIGYPKTGTTFLQRSLFGADARIAAIGRPNPQYGMSECGLRHLALRADKATFETHLDHVREEVRRSRSIEGKRASVLSDEHIATGYLTSPFALHSRRTILERLRLIWPDARVLVVVRRQPAILFASYENELRMCRTNLGADAWLDAVKAQDRPNVLDAFDFRAAIADATDVVGTDRVYIAFYEDLYANPEIFARTIASATNLPEAAVLTTLSQQPINSTNDVERIYLQIRRHIPGAMRRSALLRPVRAVINLDRFRGIKVLSPDATNRRRRFSRAHEEFLNDFYATSNAAVAAWVDRDLRALGYAVAEEAAA